MRPGPERPDLESVPDDPANGLHHRGSDPEPMSLGCDRDRLDVPRSNRSAVDVQLAFHNRCMTDDHAVDLRDDVRATNGVEPVVLREGLVRFVGVVERRVEQRPDPELLGGGQRIGGERPDAHRSTVACVGCHHPAMVEYGNGVGEATGHVPAHAGGGSMDAGAAIGSWVSNAVHTIATMPPAELAFLVFVLIAGLFVLKRAL